MSLADTDAPLWTLVRMMESESVEEWRKRYRSSLSVEDAITQSIKTIETTVVRRPGGNVLVTVAILANKAFEGEVFVNRLQRAGNKVYKVVEPDSASS